jgi:hypothetical protein
MKHRDGVSWLPLAIGCCQNGNKMIWAPHRSWLSGDGEFGHQAATEIPDGPRPLPGEAPSRIRPFLAGRSREPRGMDLSVRRSQGSRPGLVSVACSAGFRMTAFRSASTTVRVRGGVFRHPVIQRSRSPGNQASQPPLSRFKSTAFHPPPRPHPGALHDGPTGASHLVV